MKTLDAANRRLAGRAGRIASIFAATGSILLAGRAWAGNYIVAPQNPNDDPNYYNITNAAYGGGTSGTGAQNAKAISAALTAASAAGGGTVVIPAGDFQCAPLDLSNDNDVDLEIDGTLQAVSRTGGFNNQAGNYFIYWKNADADSITGSGTIDGDGSSWWNSGASAPKLINFSNADGVEVDNITVQNAPKESFTFSGSHTDTVIFDGITITNPANSPNTDGIDPNGSDFYIINSTISTGDDDIAIKASGGNATCNNINVYNCTFGTGHGVSIGGQTNLGVNGVTVAYCTFNGTNYGVRLKAGRGNGGLVQNITYSNLAMNNVPYPIYMSSWYNSADGSFEYPDVPADAGNQPFVAGSTPQWQNINISNVTATGALTAGVIYGLPEAPFQGVTLSNLNISAEYGWFIDYAGYNGTFDPTAAPDPNEEVLFENSTFNTADGNVYEPGPESGYNAVVVGLPEPRAAVAALPVFGLMLARRRRTVAVPTA
jgi:polygalacturonase